MFTEVGRVETGRLGTKYEYLSLHFVAGSEGQSDEGNTDDIDD